MISESPCASAACSGARIVLRVFALSIDQHGVQATMCDHRTQAAAPVILGRHRARMATQVWRQCDPQRHGIQMAAVIGEIDALTRLWRHSHPAWIGAEQHLRQCHQARQHQPRSRSCLAMARVRVTQVSAVPMVITMEAASNARTCRARPIHRHRAAMPRSSLPCDAAWLGARENPCANPRLPPVTRM